ncbi:MAG: pseudouridylate synthase [Prevotella denticola]|uniref:Pseudouridylate synthase n=1 Tax=Prevotella multiformis DSM 16608 TaxID=888743 RepID=F0F4D8_9BACT|nr:hypothetical protein [Prevotella multiformis]EGC21096.1 hypothetical protein HMPREF9141_0454 [Prevotella multiformis DSM 16608]
MLEFLNAIQVSLVNPDGHGKGKVYDFVADTFSYIPQLTDNEAGNYWNCDKTIVIDLPDEETRRTFAVERSAIVTVKTSDRKTHNIGTSNIPARVQISSNLTSANLVIKCKMLTDPLL